MFAPSLEGFLKVLTEAYDKGLFETVESFSGEPDLELDDDEFDALRFKRFPELRKLRKGQTLFSVLHKYDELP